MDTVITWTHEGEEQSSDFHRKGNTVVFWVVAKNEKLNELDSIFKNLKLIDNLILKVYVKQ